VERWDERPVTRFERKGRDVDRDIVDFCYRRSDRG
jgi:tRNA (guanine-N7-)-methyltransferase